MAIARHDTEATRTPRDEAQAQAKAQAERRGPVAGSLDAPAPAWPSSPRPSVEQILRAVQVTSLARELDLSYARGMTPRTLRALFSCLPSLRKLTLRYTDLPRLPDAFDLLPELRELDLSCNAFTSLPASIGMLRKLQHLSVMGNRLEALPNTLGRLGALRFFNASSNHLRYLGPELSHLRVLRVLRLASNRLQELPANLAELPDLQLLQLAFNRLTRLPPELGRLRDLRVLNVSFNALDALPDALSALTTLNHLDVTGNALIALPAGFAALENLQVRGLQRQIRDGSGSPTQLTVAPQPRASFLWSDGAAPSTRQLPWNTADSRARTAIGGRPLPSPALDDAAAHLAPQAAQSESATGTALQSAPADAEGTRPNTAEAAHDKGG